MVLLRVGLVFEGSAPAVVVRYTAAASLRWRYIELIQRLARDFELRVLDLARVLDHRVSELLSLVLFGGRSF